MASAIGKQQTKHAFGWKQQQIPGHTSHETSLQRQKGVGPLVSSQERRSLAVPLIFRPPTARYVLRSNLKNISFVRACEKMSRKVVFGALDGKMDDFSSGGIVPPPSWAYPPTAILPRPAAPRPALPRSRCPLSASPLCAVPPVVCPGFGVDK